MRKDQKTEIDWTIFKRPEDLEFVMISTGIATKNLHIQTKDQQIVKRSKISSDKNKCKENKDTYWKD